MVPRHDWYLKEWLRASGKRQADVVSELDWNKARVSLMARGAQQYTRDAVNEIAAWLNIRPYELLMHPRDALALRSLHNEVVRIAHSADFTRMDNIDDEPGKKVSAA